MTDSGILPGGGGINFAFPLAFPLPFVVASCTGGSAGGSSIGSAVVVGIVSLMTLASLHSVLNGFVEGRRGATRISLNYCGIRPNRIKIF